MMYCTNNLQFKRFTFFSVESLLAISDESLMVLSFKDSKESFMRWTNQEPHTQLFVDQQNDYYYWTGRDSLLSFMN